MKFIKPLAGVTLFAFALSACSSTPTGSGRYPANTGAGEGVVDSDPALLQQAIDSLESEILQDETHLVEIEAAFEAAKDKVEDGEFLVAIGHVTAAPTIVVGSGLAGWASSMIQDAKAMAPKQRRVEVRNARIMLAVAGVSIATSIGLVIGGKSYIKLTEPEFEAAREKLREATERIQAKKTRLNSMQAALSN